MYARYVPPKKKDSVPAAPAVIVPSQPVTRQDASSSYGRYIPPSKSQLKHPTQVVTYAESSPPAVTKRKRGELESSTTEPSSKKPKQEKKGRKEKKDKKVKRRSSIELQTIELEEKAAIPPTHDADGESKRSKSKKKKAKDASVHGARNDEERGDGEYNRHKILMEKRQKSLRRTEKLAKKDAERADVETVLAEDLPLEASEELHDLVPLPQPDPIPEAPIQSVLSSLPPWLASPIRVSQEPTTTFLEVGVDEDVAKHLESKGFKKAFAIQAAVLPLLLTGSSQKPGDVLVSAATGSGKTLAYALPMIKDISMHTVTRLRGLVVMPTRELVTQVRDVCEICASAFASGTRKRVRIGTAVGNETFKVEQTGLMEQELQYNPEAFLEEMMRLNSKWESTDQESCGEDEFFCQEEMGFPLPDHVVHPASKVDVLICTPGRLVDHLKSTPGFSLEYIQWLVVDEADKLLDQSFQQWLDIVMTSLHKGEDNRRLKSDRVRKIILSATMTRDIGQLNNLKLYRPQLVVLESLTGKGDESKDQDGVVQTHLPTFLVESAVKVDDESIKPLYLLELLKRENLLSQIGDRSSLPRPKDESSDVDTSADESSSASESATKLRAYMRDDVASKDPRGILIFTKSNETAVRLGRLLSLLSPSSAAIIRTVTSTTRSSARRAALKAFESGRLSILIASDLVSRGLDLSDLAHVINYDIPTSITNYVHRVGRTARAGKRGNAWTLFTDSEGRWFWNEIGRSEEIKRGSGKKVKRVNISSENFGDEDRRTYELALEQLGREASSSKPKKSR